MAYVRHSVKRVPAGSTSRASGGGGGGGGGASGSAFTIETWVLPMVIVSLDAFNRPVRHARSVSNHIRAHLDVRGWANRANAGSSKLTQVGNDMARLEEDVRRLLSQVRDRIRDVDDLAKPFNVGADGSRSKPTQAIPQPGVPLSQVNPKGDDAVLNLRRGTGTVHSDIQSVGCLMTAYTMLLRDKGVNVWVTDLYKANYEIVERRKFTEDAKDGIIELKTLSAQSGIVNGASPNYRERATAIPLTSDQAANQSLQAMLKNHGSVIIHVTANTGDGHWMVVDIYNNDGTYRVRDPYSGAVSNISLGVTSGHRRFQSGSIKYVERQPTP